MNGDDASTTFTDVSTGGADSPHTVTANDNAQVDTAQSVFGGAALLCDGTADNLQSLDSADFDLADGDWTVDCRIRSASFAANRTICGKYVTGDQSYVLRWTTGNTIELVYSVDGSANLTKSFAWTPSTATWYHFAMVRNGDDLMCFIDGTQIGTTQDLAGASFFNSAYKFQIGAFNNTSNPWNGWIDEFRLSKGIARWTGNFTPPVAEYA